MRIVDNRVIVNDDLCFEKVNRPFGSFNSGLLSEIVEYQKGIPSQFRFSIMIRDGTRIGSFFLSPMPGCCGIVVIHNMYLQRDYRGKKYSDLIRQGKEDLCRALGYGAVIATTIASEKHAVMNMEKSKYVMGHDFKNPRTGNNILIGVKHL